jgi:hypothetical protein
LKMRTGPRVTAMLTPRESHFRLGRHSRVPQLATGRHLGTNPFSMSDSAILATTENPERAPARCAGNRKRKCGNKKPFQGRLQGLCARRGPFRVNKLGVAQILTRRDQKFEPPTSLDPSPTAHLYLHGTSWECGLRRRWRSTQLPAVPRECAPASRINRSDQGL